MSQLTLSTPDWAMIGACALVWTPAHWRVEQEALRDRPWYQDFRVLAAGLLLLMGVTVATFA